MPKSKGLEQGKSHEEGPSGFMKDTLDQNQIFQEPHSKFGTKFSSQVLDIKQNGVRNCEHGFDPF